MGKSVGFVGASYYSSNYVCSCVHHCRGRSLKLNGNRGLSGFLVKAQQLDVRNRLLDLTEIRLIPRLGTTLKMSFAGIKRFYTSR